MEPFKAFGGRYPAPSEVKLVELTQDRPFQNIYGDEVDVSCPSHKMAGSANDQIVEKDAKYNVM